MILTLRATRCTLFRSGPGGQRHLAQHRLVESVLCHVTRQRSDLATRARASERTISGVHPYGWPSHAPLHTSHVGQSRLPSERWRVRCRRGHLPAPFRHRPPATRWWRASSNAEGVAFSDAAHGPLELAVFLSVPPSPRQNFQSIYAGTSEDTIGLRRTTRCGCFVQAGTQVAYVSGIFRRKPWELFRRNPQECDKGLTWTTLHSEHKQLRVRLSMLDRRVRSMPMRHSTDSYGTPLTTTGHYVLE